MVIARAHGGNACALSKCVHDTWERSAGVQRSLGHHILDEGPHTEQALLITTVLADAKAVVLCAGDQVNAWVPQAWTHIFSAELAKTFGPVSSLCAYTWPYALLASPDTFHVCDLEHCRLMHKGTTKDTRSFMLTAQYDENVITGTYSYSELTLLTPTSTLR